MQLDDEIDANDPNYSPWDVVPNPLDLPVLQTYTCPWTAALFKEHAEVSKAGGFTPVITFSRAIRSTTLDLLHGMDVDPIGLQ
jgi:hypothetical protein